MPLTVNAGVIDFEDLPHLTDFEFSSVMSRGYLVTHDGSGPEGPYASIIGPVGEDSLKFSGNGTKRLLAFNTSTITFSLAGKGTFDLLQFDGGESWLGPAQSHAEARQILAVGQLAGGGTVSQTFTLDLYKDLAKGMQSFAFGDGFHGLLSVTFSGLGQTSGRPEFSLDNLVVESAATALDAPSALWLAGAGLAALATARRRRISSAADAR